MERILVNPWRVRDFCPFVKTNPELEKRVAKEGFANVPPVAGFELPPEYKGRFHYILGGDGNYRRDLAARNNLWLPFLRYEQWERIHVLERGDVVIDTTKSSKLYPVRFERALLIFLHQEEMRAADYSKKREPEKPKSLLLPRS